MAENTTKDGDDKRQNRYPQEVKDLAMQVWGFQADRNAVKTHAILDEDHHVSVPIERIRYWAREDNWIEHVQELYRMQAPTMFDQAKFTLVSAAPKAARYLSDVVTYLPDGQPVIEKPDKNRIVTALGLLDRVGFVPMNRREATDHVQTGNQSVSASVGTGSDDMADLSTDELARIASGHLVDDR